MNANEKIKLALSGFRLATTPEATARSIARTNKQKAEIVARLAELEHLLTHAGVCELAARNVNVRSYMEEWEARATRAEAALAEARDGWHMANGVAELAMQHRDAAEAALAAVLTSVRGMLNAEPAHWCAPNRRFAEHFGDLQRRVAAIDAVDAARGGRNAD